MATAVACLGNPGWELLAGGAATPRKRGIRGCMGAGGDAGDWRRLSRPPAYRCRSELDLEEVRRDLSMLNEWHAMVACMPSRARAGCIQVGSGGQRVSMCSATQALLALQCSRSNKHAGQPPVHLNHSTPPHTTLSLKRGDKHTQHDPAYTVLDPHRPPELPPPPCAPS